MACFSPATSASVLPARACGGRESNTVAVFLKPFLHACLVLPLLCTTGCTTKTAYLSMQEAQREACEKYSDMQERQRCRAKASTSYEDYRQQREAATTAR